jgi:hypothetical protein
MASLFLICATLGGTILVLQFILTLLGLGGHGFDGDVSHDFATDVPHDMGGDLHGGDMGADHDAAGGMHADAAIDQHHSGHAPAADTHHGSTWLFGVISFRTMVAAITFFGIAGMAAETAEAPMHVTLAVALAAGAGAMFGVYFLMQWLYGLRTEGTVRISGAVGKTGTVYVPVPARKSGAGKIQINLQNRTMEYLALTSGDKLPTGAKVVVTEVVASDTLEVQAASD